MCFLFHKWEKWKQYEEKGILLPGRLDLQGKEYKYVDLRQRRECKKCGKVQDRFIKGA